MSQVTSECWAPHSCKVAFLLGSTTPDRLLEMPFSPEWQRFHQNTINNVTHHCSFSAASICKPVLISVGSQHRALLSFLSSSPSPLKFRVANLQENVWRHFLKRCKMENRASAMFLAQNKPVCLLYSPYAYFLNNFWNSHTDTRHDHAVMLLPQLQAFFPWRFAPLNKPRTAPAVPKLGTGCAGAEQAQLHHHRAAFSSHAAWGWASSPSLITSHLVMSHLSLHAFEP